MKELILSAKGKINLGLDVLRKREDGYHEVRMVMQTVGISDQVRLRKRVGRGLQMVAGPGNHVPLNEGNLAYQAAQLLMEEFAIPDGLEIALEKKIPIAAGMAGGSADAATVLFGVNRMFDLGLSLEELKQRGVRIGADVPYCLMRGTVLAEGIGEKLTRLPAAPDCEVVIARPPVSVSTRWVYTHLRADELAFHPDIDGMCEAIRAKDRSGMVERLGNVLETVTVPAHSVIEEIKEQMRQARCMNCLMSGSGPTVFGLFEDRDQAELCRRQIRKANLAWEVFCTHFYDVKEKKT